MNNTNFNYWMQGFFEINGPQDGNNPQIFDWQVAIIRKHLDLVKNNDGLSGFSAWLEGYLDGKMGLVNEDMGTQDYLIISDKLKQSFVNMTTSTPSPTISPMPWYTTPPGSTLIC